MRKRMLIKSYCECPDCKNLMPLQRNKNCKRKVNHKKDLWCPFCKEVKIMNELQVNVMRNLLGEIIE